MPCNIADLGEVELFQLLDETELAELAEVIDYKSASEGEIIFHAGDLGDALYIVKSGEVELFIKDTTGQKIVLTTVEKNEIFGELSMLDARPRSATSQAMVDTELFLLDRDDLLLLFKKQPDAALNMLAAMSGMLRKVDRLLQTRVSRNVNEEMEDKLPRLQRIADWIAWFSGSMHFLILNGLWFLVWIVANTVPPLERQFNPDAIVMSGTFADFDYYNPDHIAAFKRFIHETKIPVLAICGAHQLVGMAFGSGLKTLDDLDLAQKRTDRVVEYQYRFVKIVDKNDPIFEGNDDQKSGVWQEYTTEDDILRVWQNHGVQIDGVPAGFKLLASSYLCKNQMMVKRGDGQLIYCVQFHLEKSFEDWSKNPTRWEHPNESRDGRILFENFLRLALEHRGN